MKIADRLGRPSIHDDATREPVSQEGDKLFLLTEDSRCFVSQRMVLNRGDDRMSS